MALNQVPKFASWKHCTYKELRKMGRDHTTRRDFTIMTDAYTVWISEQKWGESPKQKIAIPRRLFNWLVREYEKSRALRSADAGE